MLKLKHKLKKNLIIIWILALFATIAIGLTTYYYEKNIAFKKNDEELKRITDIVSFRTYVWHSGRESELLMFSQSPFFIDAISSWFSNPNDEILEKNISKRIDLINKKNDYSSILITDISGKILYCNGDSVTELNETTISYIQKSLETKESLHTNFYNCKMHEIIHIDYISPLIEDDLTIGFLIFRAETQRTIPFVLKAYSNQLTNSFNYLFRVDNNNVIFFNSEKQDIEIDKLEKTLIENLDTLSILESYGLKIDNHIYRINPVYSTDWFILNTMSNDSLISYFRTSPNRILLYLSIVFFIVTLLLTFYYHTITKNEYAKKLIKEKGASKYYKEFYSVLQSIANGVITIDEHRIIKTVNNLASELLLMPKEELLNKSSSLLKEINPDIETIIEEVFKTGNIEETTIDNTNNQDKINSNIILSIKASPIYGNSNKIIGVALILSDKTKDVKILDKIKKSEEQYRMLFSNMTQGFALHDIILDTNNSPVNYRYLNVNQAFEKMTGFTEKELIGKTVLDVMPETEQYWINIFGKVAQTGEPLRFENYSNVLKKHFDVFAFSPQIGQFAVLFTDITKRKDYLYQLKQQKEFSQTILDRLPIAVSLSSLSKQTFKYTNDKFYEIYGWRQDELDTIDDLLHKVYPDPKYRNRIKIEMANDINSGIIENMSWSNVEITSKSGEKKIVSLVAIPLIEQDTIIYVSIDNTQIHHTEELARESEAVFSSIFYDNFSMMLLIDPETKQIVDANDAALDFYGWEREKFLTMSVYDLNINKDNAINDVVNYVVQNKHQILETKHRLKDGQIKDVYIYTCIIKKRKKRFIHNIIYDNTEKKRAEIAMNIQEQKLRDQNKVLLNNNEKIKKINKELDKARKEAEESNKLKTAFLANMSHEIRTPMNAIVGFADILLLELDEVPEDINSYISHIKDNSEHLLSIIDDILDLSKMEAGKINLTPALFDLNSLFDKLKESVEALLLINTNKKIDFIVEKGVADDSFMIFADSFRIEQILFNLITNAVKYTDSGYINMSYKLINSTDIVFIVADTGSGIDAKHKNAIFDRFTRVDDEDIYKTREGIGLGLSITKNLVAAMKGTIDVESEVGKGTKFIITIPFNQN